MDRRQEHQVRAGEGMTFVIFHPGPEDDRGHLHQFGPGEACGDFWRYRCRGCSARLDVKQPDLVTDALRAAQFSARLWRHDDEIAWRAAGGVADRAGASGAPGEPGT